MTMQTITDAEADMRWRAWQARGAEGDRRSANRMRALLLLVAAGLAVWSLMQLA